MVVHVLYDRSNRVCIQGRVSFFIYYNLSHATLLVNNKIKKRIGLPMHAVDDPNVKASLRTSRTDGNALLMIGSCGIVNAVAFCIRVMSCCAISIFYRPFIIATKSESLNPVC